MSYCLMFETAITTEYETIKESTRTKYRPFTITQAESYFLKGEWTLIYPRPTSSFGYGLKCKSFAHAILEQMYCLPDLIDLGVFQTAIRRTFKIWNSYLYKTTNCYELKRNNLPDVYLISNPLVTYLGLEWKILELEAAGIGVPIISGSFAFYFLDVTPSPLILQIRGLRVGVPNFLCAPPGDVTYRYNYLTTISVTDKRKEQRRTIHERVIRSLSGRFLIFSNIQEHFTHSLDFLANRVVATPILFEPMHPVYSGNLKDRTNIAVVEDISKYTELFNLTAVALYDKTKCEVKQLDHIDINNRTLYFKDAVINSFLGSETIIFPIFFGVLTSVRSLTVVDDILNLDIEIKEYV